MRGPLLALLLLLPAPAAPEGTAAIAEAAARRLEEAGRMLDGAGGADDRIAALTETVRAYEEGLALLREGLRGAAVERRAIEDALAADREDTQRLLGALMAVSEAPGPVTLLHPAGPLGTARAGMIMADVAPALQARADGLRERLDALRDIEALQADALATLAEGLASAQAARAELARAAAGRRDLPRAYADDPVGTAVLLASTETLDAFADGLAGLVDAAVPPAGEDARARAGTLALPVRGTVLRGPGEADAAGVSRPGLVIATEPRALVTTPLAATLRFKGPLLDYGTVAILEPEPGTLWVLAGLAEAWGEPGEVFPAGAAVGMMGGEAPDPASGADAILSGGPDAGGAALDQTLYLEVREDGAAVDPARWFRPG